MFRQYDWFDQNTFLDYLKQIHRKFPKCYIFLDKAKQHHRSKKVLQYFDLYKKDLIPVYLPTASPEFMVLEEIWHIAKIGLCYSTIHHLQILKIKYLHILEQKDSILIWGSFCLPKLVIRKHKLIDICISKVQIS